MQLCWSCRKATNPAGNDCPWSSKCEPVEGWIAKYIKREYTSKGNKPTYESYAIESCPLYQNDTE